MLFLVSVLDPDAGVGGDRGVLRAPQPGVNSSSRVRSLRTTGGVGLLPGWRCWLVAFVGLTAAAPAAVTGLSMAAVHPKVHERHTSES